MKKTYSIAIIGAGPAGATLARILHKSPASSQLNITVYEKDESRSSRSYQGGCLDLHPPTGLAALRKAGLWDEFMKHARYEGEELRIGDLNGTVYVHIDEAPQIEGLEARPEIDREALKDLLLDSLPASMIQWGKHLKSVNKEKQTLTFADATTEGPFDLIIGADGAWSKVRNVLTDIKPHYSGISSFKAKITPESAGDQWPAISAMVGKGSNFSYSYGKSITGQRMGDGSLYIGISKRTTPDWADTITSQTQGSDREIARALQEEYKSWHGTFQTWFPAMHHFHGWALYELPIGHQWQHTPHCTLIGDAANLMTPFAGEGANLAMRGAMELAEAIEVAITQDRGLDRSIDSFEREMFVWMEKSMRRTMRNKDGMFAVDAPARFLASMVGMLFEEKGWDLNRGILWVVPVTRIVHACFSAVGWFGGCKRWVRESLWRKR